jgi:hypothetical protein
VPQIVRVEIQANLQWGAWQDPASKAWIGECTPLGLIAEGETWSDLQEMIADITNALMTDLLREGRLPKFLEEKGWTVNSPLPKPEAEDVRFDVPLPVVRTPAPHAHAA